MPRGKAIFEADELVKKAIERHGDKLAVSCSFGKDSLVVLHMALKVEPDIRVIFNNTGVEFSETIALKDKLKREWKLNLIETKSYKKNFWDCIKEYGLPTGKSGSIKNGNNWPKCCYYLKEMPMILACREHGIKGYLTGITAEESWNRMNVIRMCGQRYYVKKADVFKYHPIAYWTTQDVWEYIHANKIPYNQVYLKYDGIYDRCGCLPCSAYKGWQEKLSQSHPKLFKILLERARASDFYKKKKGKQTRNTYLPFGLTSSFNEDIPIPEGYPYAKK